VDYLLCSRFCEKLDDFSMIVLFGNQVLIC
jgi:hypothetical protein